MTCSGSSPGLSPSHHCFSSGSCARFNLFLDIQPSSAPISITLSTNYPLMTITRACACPSDVHYSLTCLEKSSSPRFASNILHADPLQIAPRRDICPLLAARARRPPAP